MQGDDGGTRLFVLQKQELTELIDHDGDDVIDEYRVAVTGWPVSDNFHEFAFGLVEKEGPALRQPRRRDQPRRSHHRPADRRTRRHHRDEPRQRHLRKPSPPGLRTPNGIGIGVDDEIFVTDNQGDWLPSSKILHVAPGNFFGSHINPPHPWEDRPVTPPVAWLPQGEIGNSPTNLVKVPGWLGAVRRSDVPRRRHPRRHQAR